jgi:drug/metabolite transporter (DMT)-like permease
MAGRRNLRSAAILPSLSPASTDGVLDCACAALNNRVSTKSSVFALILGAMAIGFSPIFVRLSEVGPTATAFWRVALAFPPLFLLARLSPAPAWQTAPRKEWRLLAWAGVFFAADLAVWHLALGLTLVANATLESNFAVIFVPLFGWLLFRQKVTRRFLLAVAVALAGTLLLIGKNAHVSAQTLHGDALGICSAVFYSGYILSVKFARDRRLGTADIMAVTAFVSAATLLALALVTHEPLLPATPHGWLILLGLAMTSQVAGQGLITYSLAVLPASTASVGLLVQPATAALAAWAILGEALAPGQWMGAVILLTGLWLARPKPETAKTPASPSP